mgnify:CR=1 FL=1
MLLPMTKDQVVAHFGSVTSVAKALGVSQPSVTNWGERPPELRQLQIEAATGGKLKAGPECDKFRVAAA